MYRLSWTISAVLLIQAASARAASQLDLNFEAAAAAHHADKLLDDVYLKLLRKADAGYAHQIQSARKRWDENRQKVCALEAAAYDGGSIAPLIYWRCYEWLTWSRVAMVTILLKTHR